MVFVFEFYKNFSYAILLFMEIPYRQKLPPKKYTRKKKFIIILFFLFISFVFIKSLFWLKKIIWTNDTSVIEIVETQKEIAKIEKNNDRIIEYKISEDDIPAEIFKSQGGFDANDMEAILSSSENVYDFTNIKIGKNIRFYFDEKEEKAKRVEYDKDTEEMIIIERTGNNFTCHKDKIAYEVSQETARGIIDDFFYVDAMQAGIQEATVLEMGDIFSFDIDFTTEIQLNDEFIIIYEKRLRNGKEAPDGKILGAKFINSGTAYFAYYFDNGGKGGYYDFEGRLLERQFLKAPLSYRRISSGFTGARLHPITRKISAHYQVDYAAPTGTPVVASAHGTVVSAGWEGGWGNMIRLKHDNSYATHYGHLSKYASGIRSGAQVSRGQVIGYVGSTGWSTGSHLDYGIKLNGIPVNPLKLNLPKGEPISQNEMENFEKIKNQYANLLN